MPRGGKRAGAGRKKGSGTRRTRKTNQIAAQAAGAGVLPLQVMLEAMRECYEARDLANAAKLARDAAPYVHPRLTSVKVGGDPENDTPIAIEFLPLPARADGTD